MSKFKEILNNPLPSKQKQNDHLNPLITIDVSDYIDEEIFIEDKIPIFNQNGVRFQQTVKNASVSIYGDEGPYPHFHIWSKTGDFKEICIRLDTNRYFKHAYKTGELNSDGRGELMKFLKKKYKKKKDKKDDKFKNATTIYSALCIGWNCDMDNPIKIDPFGKMPNYRTILEANSD